MLVEKISYNIDWKKFKVGYSMFIPCLDPSKAKKDILRVTNRLKVDVLLKIVIEDGVQGIPMWRI
jgi:hypothetical protein